MSGDVVLPAGLAWMSELPETASWLASLPSLVERAEERWSLTVGPPYPSSHVSYAAPARTADGDEVVLKVQYPHHDCAHEAEALALWGGTGAVRLLDHHATDSALLLEQARPGSSLADRGWDEALDVCIGLLPRLWVPVPDDSTIVPLVDEAHRWAAELPPRWEAAGRPIERRLVEGAVDLLVGLAGSQGEPVLVHQDLHAANVVSSEREPWLAIDPKPVVGEREMSVAPLARGYGRGHSRGEVLGRIERLTSELGLDRDRASGWAVGQALAWSIDDRGVQVQAVETARWILDGSAPRPG